MQKDNFEIEKMIRYIKDFDKENNLVGGTLYSFGGRLVRI